MLKSDSERINKIIEIWDSMQNQMVEKEITREMVLSDQFAQWAVTTPLYNIGEQVYNISNDLKEQYPEIPWKLVSGLRHRLVHDYDGINWNIIVEVLFDEMKVFIEAVKKIR